MYNIFCMYIIHFLNFQYIFVNLQKYLNDWKKTIAVTKVCIFNTQIFIIYIFQLISDINL